MHEKRHVSAGLGWTGDKSDLFSILLGSSLRRGTIGSALQIHIEQNGAAWLFGIESDRHPINDQFDQGYRNDMWT